jgi:DNA repair exonuclease SbcCD ATPase subunit
MTQMKADLRERVGAVKGQQARLEAALQRVEAALPATASGEAAAAAQELKEAVGEMRKRLDAFQLEPPPRPEGTDATPPPVKL